MKGALVEEALGATPRRRVTRDRSRRPAATECAEGATEKREERQEEKGGERGREEKRETGERWARLAAALLEMLDSGNAASNQNATSTPRGTTACGHLDHHRGSLGSGVP